MSLGCRLRKAWIIELKKIWMSKRYYVEKCRVALAVQQMVRPSSKRHSITSWSLWPKNLCNTSSQMRGAAVRSWNSATGVTLPPSFAVNGAMYIWNLCAWRLGISFRSLNLCIKRTHNRTKSEVKRNKSSRLYLLRIIALVIIIHLQTVTKVQSLPYGLDRLYRAFQKYNLKLDSI